MRALSYILLAALVLTGIYGTLMILGEPTPGKLYDSIPGIILMKAIGVSCIAASIYGIKKLFS